MSMTSTKTVILTFHSHLPGPLLFSVVLLLNLSGILQRQVHLQFAATLWSRKKLLFQPANEQFKNTTKAVLLYNIT